MTTITDPQAISFVNNELRPACDAMIKALRTFRQASANYSANGIGPLVAANPTLQNEYIADGATNADGSKGDGRTPLLGYDVDNAVNEFNTLNTYINSQAGMETALTKPSVNTQPVF